MTRARELAKMLPERMTIDDETIPCREGEVVHFVEMTEDECREIAALLVSADRRTAEQDALLAKLTNTSTLTVLMQQHRRIAELEGEEVEVVCPLCQNAIYERESSPGCRLCNSTGTIKVRRAPK